MAIKQPKAYYNENDKNAAAWLRNLIAAGLIADGDVDERSIVDVKAEDLEGYCQCHFFAGIAGWSLALRMAGIPDDMPVWTGSCPCQPFSCAGKQKGTQDERHLWPEFARLIGKCGPELVFGEQVASKAGREWLFGVRTDLEKLGYEVGAADLCAASAGEKAEGWVRRGADTVREPVIVGAPHIRQRLFWMAYSELPGSARQRKFCGQPRDQSPSKRTGTFGGMAYSPQSRRSGFSGSGQSGIAEQDAFGSLAYAQNTNGPCGISGEEAGTRAGSQRRKRSSASSASGPMVNAQGDARQSDIGAIPEGQRKNRQETPDPHQPSDAGPVLDPGAWSDFSLISCIDGKTRRSASIESGVFPLAYGVPGRVGLLRGYGNAIVPQVAAIFVQEGILAIGDFAAVNGLAGSDLHGSRGLA